jgi:hypothetical protein
MTRLQNGALLAISFCTVQYAFLVNSVCYQAVCRTDRELFNYWHCIDYVETLQVSLSVSVRLKHRIHVGMLYGIASPSSGKPKVILVKTEVQVQVGRLGPSGHHGEKTIDLDITTSILLF